MSHLNELNAKSKQEIEEAKLNTENVNEQNERLNKNCDELKQTIEALNAGLTDKDNKAMSLSKSLAECELRVEESGREIVLLNTRLSQLNETHQLAVQQNEKNVLRLGEEKVDLLRLNKEANDKVEKIQTLNDQVNKQLSDLAAEKQDLSERIAVLSGEREQLEKKMG